MFFRKAVLFIHGFSSGTWENEYLVNHLTYYENFDVYVFTLPGHNKTFVEKVKYEEWIEASEREVEKLLLKYNGIYVVGHSMGGVIAAHLASKYNRIKKLVLISPSFEYININQNTQDLKQALKKRRIKFKEEYDEEIYQELISKLVQIPIPMVLQFTKFIKTYKKCIKGVRCNTLILYGDKDELVPFKGITYAFDSVPARKKYLTIVRNVKHRILISDRKEEVSKYISSYFKGGLRWIKTRRLKI